MGNHLSVFPVTAQDVVLSHLDVLDAKQLMCTNKFLLTQVRRSRRFWIEKANALYEKDPFLFLRLKDPSVFPHDALVKHVCAADTQLQDTFGRIANGIAAEGAYQFEDEVHCMAVDEKACILVVQLAGYLTRVFDLRRFGDPPLRALEGLWMTDIVVHGNIIFYRSPDDHMRFHADVFNWRVNLPMASLEPRWHDMALHLSKSDQFLIAYDRHNHCIRAYPLVTNGYERDSVAIYLPGGTTLHDMAVKDDVVMTILVDQSSSHLFKSFKVGTNAVQQQFTIRSPLYIMHSRISYPFILLAHPPDASPRQCEAYRVNGPRMREAYRVYGPRIRITGSDHRPFGDPSFLVLCAGERKSSIARRPTAGRPSQFIFVEDYPEEYTYICHVGEAGSPFLRTDAIFRSWPPDLFISFGLSVIYARRDLLIFRRYARRSDFVMT